MTTAPRFTVYLHPLLDAEFRATGIFPELQLEQLHHELPRFHRAEPRLRERQHRLPKQPRLFRGAFAHSNSGFSYLQIGNRLHVIEFWLDGKLLSKRTRPPMDVVIGELPPARRRR